MCQSQHVNIHVGPLETRRLKMSNCLKTSPSKFGLFNDNAVALTKDKGGDLMPLKQNSIEQEKVLSKTAVELSPISFVNGMKHKMYPSLSDVARIVGVSLDTVEYLLDTYDIPWFYVGNTRRLQWQLLEEALEREVKRAINRAKELKNIILKIPIDWLP
jgi:hypothetical protein